MSGARCPRCRQTSGSSSSYVATGPLAAAAAAAHSLTHSRACKSQSNYKDLDDKRVVTDYEIKEFARECGSHVVAAEASMLNRFGVKAIKTFFNLPFLQMEVRRDRARMHAFNRLDRQSMAHRHYHLFFHHSATFSRSSSDAIRRRSRSLSRRSRS